MNRDYGVSVTLNEDEYKILFEIMEKFNRRSYKGPNQSETLRHAVKFANDNIDMPELVGDLKRELAETKKELEEVKKKNELFEQSFLEFQNKIK